MKSLDEKSLNPIEKTREKNHRLISNCAFTMYNTYFYLLI